MLPFVVPRLAGIALLLLVPLAAAFAQTPRGILGPTVQGGALPLRSSPATVDSRLVQPDLAAVAALARSRVEGNLRERFILDLMDGLEIEAEVTAAEVRPQGTTVVARLPGIALGSALLTLERGVLVGSVSFPDGRYTVVHDAGNRYRVERKAAQFFPPERPPRPAPVAPSQQRAAGPAAVPTDSGRLVDVMVLWTPAARGAGDSAAMHALAQAAVDQANLVYLNSGVAQRLRLVHATEVPYTERSGGCTDPTSGVHGSDAFECALFDVTGTSDGAIDDVHALRDVHGADLVALMIRDVAFCGVAWLPTPPSPSTSHLAFAVIEADCAVANHSFVHELGHTMGAHHDPWVLEPGACPDGREPAAFCFSRGTVNVVDRWRTVMAYRDQCTAAGAACPRIDYLSTPMLEVDGATLGDPATRNNAHTLNRFAGTVAAYRAIAPLHPLAPRFTDVALAHPLFGSIEFLGQAGITAGCGTGRFCPDAWMTRAQGALLLERALRAANWEPPAPTGRFDDVPVNDAAAPWIEALSRDGITNGCTTNAFCPTAALTRAQAAVMLVRARCGVAYVPSSPAPATFADVPPTHPFYGAIEKLHALGISSGCATSPLRFCPDAPATRGQMAVLVERAHPFLAPSEACAP